jgi:hypothetical protein
VKKNSQALQKCNNIRILIISTKEISVMTGSKMHSENPLRDTNAKSHTSTIESSKPDPQVKLFVSK